MQESNTTSGRQLTENRKTATEAARTIQTHEGRHFADLTLTGEVTLSVIKEPGSSFAAHGDGESFSGSILHISEKAVLIETARAAQEGALLSLSVLVEPGETISDTLALVTRIDQEDDAWIMGFSFVGRDHLADILSGAELDLLDKKFGSFTAQVKRMLSQRPGQRNGKGA
ncbi:MAG: PilZ domain-containing protein [candidate division Zixibacteria bacterium]|nr:PilZ domain-containing protein [candidate division Zixibacteria bacterium]